MIINKPRYVSIKTEPKSSDIVLEAIKIIRTNRKGVILGKKESIKKLKKKGRK